MYYNWIASITAFFQQLAESQQPKPIAIPVEQQRIHRR